MDKLQAIRGVAFDLDGTLVDSAPGLTSAVDQALYALELPVAGEERVVTWIGNGVLDRFLEDESLFGEFLRTPVSEGGVEPLVVEPPHVVVEVGA